MKNTINKRTNTDRLSKLMWPRLSLTLCFSKVRLPLTGALTVLTVSSPSTVHPHHIFAIHFFALSRFAPALSSTAISTQNAQ